MFDLSKLTKQQLSNLSLELYDISIAEYVQGKFLYMSYPLLGQLFAAVAVEDEKREAPDNSEWTDLGGCLSITRNELIGIVLLPHRKGCYYWYVFNRKGKIVSSGFTESKSESKSAVEGATK